jgi:hypothetical protein
MKIIKKGIRPVRECDRCGCVFAYTFDEVRKVFTPDVMEEYLVCPFCRVSLTIKRTVR